MNTELLELLVSKGLSAQDIVDVSRLLDAPKKRTANAERQARHRQRIKEGVTEGVTDGVISNVTDNAPNNVTDPLSLPPNEYISNPPTHTPDNKPARVKAEPAAKPAGVSEQVWTDFLGLRKLKRAPMTPTALAGIEREAVKAGWTLQAALEKALARGWQGFEADWVKDEAAQGKPPGSSAYAAHKAATRHRTPA